jgi:type I restriction enzyme, S subunit
MNKSEQLPANWVLTTIGEVANPERHRVSPEDHHGLPFIGMDDVESETMRLLGTKSAADMKSTAEHFWPNDVLYGSLRPYLNKVYRPDFEGLCSAEFIVFRKSPRLESKFLQYFLNQWSFVAFINRQNTGDRPRVKFNQMADYPFPLPPVEEQKQIVDEIEKQFTRLDAAVINLKRIQANLARYKASVLKAACEGRLVPQDPDDEPASELLARILAERQRKWEEANPKKKYVEPEPPDTSELPELPAGWVWARADQVCDPIANGSTPKADKMFDGFGDFPFLKVYNLTFDGTLDFDTKPTFIGSETQFGLLNRSRVRPGDVLMNIVGPPLGKVSIVPDTFPEWNINQAIVAFRTLHEEFSRRYLSYIFMGPTFSMQALKATAKATAGQFNLNVSACRRMLIPVPPFREQMRIVDEVERLVSVSGNAEAVVSGNLVRSERLRQTILQRAFTGKLVQESLAQNQIT